MKMTIYTCQVLSYSIFVHIRLLVDFRHSPWRESYVQERIKSMNPEKIRPKRIVGEKSPS